MRRLDFAAITTQIREPQIIRNDEHDVGPVPIGSRLEQRRGAQEDAEDELFHFHHWSTKGSLATSNS